MSAERLLAELETTYASLSLPRYLLKYITPPHRAPPSLKWVTVYGGMYSGKSFGVSTLMAQLRRHGINFTYVKSYSLVDFVEYAMSNRLNGRVILFVDDALLTAYSTQNTEKRAMDKLFAVYRHVVGRITDITAMTVFFAAQKLSVLNPLVRSAPVLIVTTSPSDRTDHEIIRYRIRESTKRRTLLRLMDYLSYIKEIDDNYKKYYIVITRLKAGIVALTGEPLQPDIEIPPNFDDIEKRVRSILDVLSRTDL